MRVGVLGTPRPLPDRLVPALAGSAVVALALPIFLLAGWRVEAWAVGAVLWVAGQVLLLLVRRLPGKPGTLGNSFAQAFGTIVRATLVMVVLIAAVASDPALALAAAAVYAAAYSVELGLALAAYFGGPA